MSRFKQLSPSPAPPTIVAAPPAQANPSAGVLAALPFFGRPLISNDLFTLAVACYAFLLSSVAIQFLAISGGGGVPLVAIGFFVVFLIYLASGHALRFTSTGFALPWFGLLFWWLLAGSTGVYPGRSVTYLAIYALRIHTLPLIFCAIALDLRGVKRILLAAGLGLLVVLYFCFTAGYMSEDRFVIPRTSFENANDLALHLLLAASLFLAFYGAGLAGKLLASAVIPVTMYYVLKTGSRGNLFVMVTLLVVTFLLLPAGKKLLVVALVALAATVSIPLMPKQTMDRLRTIFTPADETNVLNQNAVDSTNARLQLQQRAIQLTIEHPILGVGPLNFEDAVETMVQSKEGHKSGWQVSHNSYLEVSSETGFPGLIFYTWTIFLCLRLNYRWFRRQMKAPLSGQATLIPFSLLLATITYAAGVLFCSIAYDYYLSLLVALTAANHLVMQQEELRTAARHPAAAA